MSEENAEHDAPRGEPAAPAPELTGFERAFVRISVWQTVLSLVGLFVAGVALYAALSQSNAVQRQTAAAVWPYLQLSVADHENESDALFQLSLTNAGVGPARMRAMRVTVNGEAITTWADMVRAVGAADQDLTYAQNAARNRVLRPGERVDIFSTTERPLVSALRAVVADPDNAIEYCYCSIFDACWLADSRRPDENPAPVRQCPDYGAAGFQN
ncbi:MAG: hypothetical protein AB7J28_09710 [Hyphomonadaceae bacterium]